MGVSNKNKSQNKLKKIRLRSDRTYFFKPSLVLSDYLDAFGRHHLLGGR